MKWSKQDILEVDEKLVEEGIPFHARSFHVAKELLGNSWVMGPNGNSEISAIEKEYAEIFPSDKDTWPGSGTGFVNSLDRVEKVVQPVIYGTVRLSPYQLCGFDSESDFVTFCRNRDDITQHVSAQAECVYIINDLHIEGATYEYPRFLWEKCKAYINAISDNLSSSYFIGFSNSETWLIFEFAAKCMLDIHGYNGGLKSIGHSKGKLATALESIVDKNLMREFRDIIEVLPNYTDSRYKINESSRINVVTQASAAQLGAALCASQIQIMMKNRTQNKK